MQDSKEGRISKSFCVNYCQRLSKYEDMANDAEKQIRSVSRYIRGILKKTGGYDGTQGYQIEMVATDIVVFRKIRKALLEAESVTVTEFSREGDPREKPHPLLFQLREQSKVVSKGLDLLMMNIKSKKGKAEAADSFAEFMSAMGRDD